MAERANSWSLSGALRGMFGRKTIDDETWDDLEDALFSADFGSDVTDAAGDSRRAPGQARFDFDPPQPAVFAEVGNDGLYHSGKFTQAACYSRARSSRSPANVSSAAHTVMRRDRRLARSMTTVCPTPPIRLAPWCWFGRAFRCQRSCEPGSHCGICALGPAARPEPGSPGTSHIGVQGPRLRR